MAAVVNSLFWALSNAITNWNSLLSSPSGGDVTREIPYFGPSEWKKHLKVDVVDLDIPKSLQLALDSPCPFWPSKLTKETHVLCLIPKGMTVSQLLGSNASTSSFIKETAQQAKESYWMLMTKEVIPNTRHTSFEEQNKRVNQHAYEVPTMLEAGIAVLAAKLLSDVLIYPKPGHFTRCKEKLDNWPMAIGNDSFIPFCIRLDDWSEGNGVAGVLHS